MLELILFASIFTASALLTSMIRAYAMRGGLLDTPNARSSHETPMPRGGGLSIVITFSGLLLYLYLAAALSGQFFFALIAGGILIGLVGFLDDHRHVPRSYRIGVHFVGAGLAVYVIEYHS